MNTSRMAKLAALFICAVLIMVPVAGWADSAGVVETRSGADSLLRADESAQPLTDGDATTTVDSKDSAEKASVKKKEEKYVPPIADGVYFIGCFGAVGNVVGVEDGALDAGTNVSTTKRSGSPAQRWAFAFDGKRSYTVTNVATGLKLGVVGKAKDKRPNVVQLRTAKNKKALEWEVQKTKGKSFRLVNRLNGKALNVMGGKNLPGRNVRAVKAGSAKSQRFRLREVPVLKGGVYAFYTKLAQRGYVMNVSHGSTDQNAPLNIAQAADVLAHRFRVTSLGDNEFSLQSISGRYLADDEGQVVQKARPKSGKLFKSQRWKASVQGTGIVFTNVATGRNMGVSGGKARAGAKLRTYKATGVKAQRFRPERVSQLVPNGMYAFKVRDTDYCLDVAAGSWDDGANANLYRSNKTIAQKFSVKAKGKYYRITMALSGTALQAGNAGETSMRSNVRMSAAAVNSNQLWTARVSDNGIEFVNKATGGVLGAAGDKTHDKRNVITSRDRVGKTQGWKLIGTRVTSANVKDLNTLINIIKRAPAGRNGNVGISTKGTGYEMSGKVRSRLTKAIHTAWRNGGDASFLMVDLNSGVTVAYGADRVNYGASTFKAAYVTYILQDIWEHGWGRNGNTAGLMFQTIRYSNNSTYASLRARFGTNGFRAWLDTVGLGRLANSPYPYLTARELALVWAKILSYERSGGRYSSYWRYLFKASYFSSVKEELGGSNRVYSKPGWYPQVGDYAALNDAAIVRGDNKKSYLVSLLTSVNCYSQKWIARGVARAVDDAAADIRRQLG